MTPNWPMDTLRQCLLDILRELDGCDFPLIFCGGFGLYLKQMMLQEQGLTYKPLLPGELWPRARTTDDMDMLVRTEILADAERFSRLRQVLDKLGYQPIEGAEYMQFLRLADGAKVDLLTGPVPDILRDKVIIRDRRIRPAGGSVGLHAHRTDEAIGFQDDDRLQSIRIEGCCTDGQPYEGTVFIPPPVTFLMMKLFAFRDRCRDKDKDFGRHHAMDLYRVVAMLSYQEFQQTREAICHQWHNDVVPEARQIVADYFADPTFLGLLRLQEHQLFEHDMDTKEFMQALTDLFAKP